MRASVGSQKQILAHCKRGENFSAFRDLNQAMADDAMRCKFADLDIVEPDRA